MNLKGYLDPDTNLIPINKFKDTIIFFLTWLLHFQALTCPYIGCGR